MRCPNDMTPDMFNALRIAVQYGVVFTGRRTWSTTLEKLVALRYLEETGVGRYRPTRRGQQIGMHE